MTRSAPTDNPVELTHYIETRYHARYRAQLPDLLKLAEMIEDIHYGDEDVPEGLSDILRRMIGAMEVHMKKEEQLVFPAIRSGSVHSIEQPIAVMRVDHDGHDWDISRIREITGGFTLPQNACTSWATLYERLAEFVDDLTEQMRLENEVLFPQFEPGALSEV